MTVIHEMFLLNIVYIVLSSLRLFICDSFVSYLQNSLHLTQPTPYCQYPMLNTQSSGQASGGSNNGMGGISPTLDILKVLGLQSDIPLQRQASTGPHHQPLYNDFSMSADLFASRPWTSLNTLFSTSATDPYSIERAAKLYRNAASERYNTPNYFSCLVCFKYSATIISISHVWCAAIYVSYAALQ